MEIVTSFDNLSESPCSRFVFTAKMVKIFVGNLTDECTNEDLHALFSQ